MAGHPRYCIHCQYTILELYRLQVTYSVKCVDLWQVLSGAPYLYTTTTLTLLWQGLNWNDNTYIALTKTRVRHTSDRNYFEGLLTYFSFTNFCLFTLYCSLYRTQFFKYTWLPLIFILAFFFGMYMSRPIIGGVQYPVWTCFKPFAHHKVFKFILHFPYRQII